MLPDRHAGRLVDAAVEAATAPPLGCRTLCQYPGCGRPAEVIRPTFPGGEPFWSHLEPPPEDVPPHRATPAEQPEPTQGERLVASVETSVAAYQRGRREGLHDFATHLRNLARRGVNERVTESMLAIADIADREAEGRL